MSNKIKVVEVSGTGSRHNNIVVPLETYLEYDDMYFEDDEDRENYYFVMCENGSYYDEKLHEIVDVW